MHVSTFNQISTSEFLLVSKTGTFEVKVESKINRIKNWSWLQILELANKTSYLFLVNSIEFKKDCNN